ncbi:hypothetical protein IVB12_03935 [Bradyrhizobium sp. 179]|uniref:hypothetical protein n=1 Tax=Bradyrhizobium sp. 179 TaxID=2782648 RepID=UPI001FF70A14|nr:hypothetical protein [Bradyrhizobium sp. 179]MCK1541152.1 hypothetical protein [Bradyrhizobium sp. 179]
MSTSIQGFKKWVTRLCGVAFFAGVANLGMAGAFETHRSFRIVGSLVVFWLATLAWRAVAKIDANPTVAIGTIERVLNALLVFCLICSPYAIYSDSALRSLTGVLILVINLAIGIGAFLFARSMISEVRTLASSNEKQR